MENAKKSKVKLAKNQKLQQIQVIIKKILKCEENLRKKLKITKFLEKNRAEMFHVLARNKILYSNSKHA